MTFRASAAVALRVAAFSLIALCTAQSAEAQLNEHCTVSVLNRTVRVNPDGSWELPNVPAGFGPVKARATCVENGVTKSGESDFFTITPNRMNAIPPITFGVTTPIPTTLALTPVNPQLTSPGQTLQLTVMATYPNASTRDVTALSNGTSYISSDPGIASVSTDGLVTAVASGTVVVQASNDGASGIRMVRVVFSSTDTDDDGIPDDYELAHGMNPANAVDAMEDFDRDGLTNLQEYQLGTDLRLADTDGDGLTDGREAALGTNPIIRDTDGDGISDGLEVQSASNPLDAASYNLAGALSSVAVTPSLFNLTFNTVAGDASLQLQVTGILRDGTALDLTSTQRGTNYSSNDLAICNFGGTDGLIFAGQSGGCTITASVGGFSAQAVGTVTTFAPVPLSSVNLGGPGNGVDVSGDYVYVAVGATGLQVVDVVNRSAPRVVATLALTGTANDVKLQGAKAFVAAGAAGLHVVDISNPLVPRLLGTADTPGDALDVRVRGDLAFVADGSAGLQIIDVTNPASPHIVGSAATSVSLGVDIEDTLAVVASGSAGIYVVDVSNPVAPVILGVVDTPGDARDVVIRGGIASVADYTGSLRTIDLRVPTAPVLAGTIAGDVGGYLLDVAQMDTLTFGADIFFVNGVPITDVSDPFNPRSRPRIDFPGDATGLGIAVDGSYVYLGTDSNQLYIGQYRLQQDTNGVPPTVSIVAPRDRATFVEGETIALTVTATDDIAVASVALLVDGASVATDTTAPYEFSTTAPVGVSSLTFAATATDLGANTGFASSVQVNVIPDPLTTVAGRVVDENQQPVAGVAVSVVGHSATTAADGRFSITGVPTIQRALIVNATLAVPGGSPLTGRSTPTAVVRGGITDVGTIVVKSVGYETDIGSLVVRCDDCSVAQALPFTFPFGGTFFTSVNISNNGYVWFDTGGYIYAFTTDLIYDFSNPGSGLYVNSTIPGRFVITWFKERLYFQQPGSKTAQMILFEDGRVQLGYQEIEAPYSATVGVFPESASKYTQVDLSADVSSTADEAVYENFDSFGGNSFDLAGSVLLLTPNASGGYDSNPVPDTFAPIVSIVSPASGALVTEGSVLHVVVSATDDRAVTSVNLLVGGQVVATRTGTPYQFDVPVPVGASSMTLSATAVDRRNNLGVSTDVVVGVIRDTGIPLVEIIQPVAGSTVIEGSELSATVAASDDVAVTRVDFLIDGSVVSSVAAPPYQFTAMVPLGTTSITLGARAVDPVGNVGVAPDVLLSVIPDPPPAVDITFPLSGSSLLEGAVVPVTVQATDNTAVTQVDLSVNDQLVATDVTSPFQFLFTVPAGVSSLTFSTSARDTVGKIGTSTNVVVSVAQDPLTTVQGTVVDRSGAPVAGAQVSVAMNGLLTQVFNFGTVLTTLPDLTGLTPDVTAIVSTPNMPNPGGVFGADPFGFGPALSRAVRFTGSLRTTVAGTYAFSVRVNAGGRLTINGTTVVNLPDSNGTFQTGSGTIELPVGTASIELQTFDNGGAEVVLRYAVQGDQLEPIQPGALIPAIAPYQSISEVDGTFSIPNVPTAQGPIAAFGTANVAGTVLSGKSASVAAVPGGTTNLGDIVLSASSAILYFADYSAGTDRMAAALAVSGHQVTTATSLTDFATKISSGDFRVGILFQQGNSGRAYDLAFSALAAHVAAGGAAIGADWTRSSVSAASFWTSFVGGVNLNQLTVTEPSLLIGITNPVSLTNPGWGTFSYGLAASGGASCTATFSNGSCAIVTANGGRTFFNGFLGDTLNAATGQQLYLNEIGAVLGAR